MNSAPLPENNPQDRPDRLKEYAGLLYDVASLITEIEADQEHGDHSEQTFTFELLGNDLAEIPSEVRALMPSIDQIDITLTKDRTHEEPSIALSIDFTSRDALLTVSRSHEGDTAFESDILFDTSYHYQPDVLTPADILADAKAQINNEADEVFDNRLSSIDKIPTAKINALIMSLIYPDPERGYEMFADVNLLTPEAFDSLIDSLHLSALTQNNSLGHRFNSSDTFFTYYKQADEHLSFNVQYLEKNTDRVITARSDMDTDFRIVFTIPSENAKDEFSPSDAPTFDIPEPLPYYPTSEDLNYLRTVLKTEMYALNPSDVELVDDNIPGGLEPEQALIDKKTDTYSRKHVQAVLDNLGFNAPDAGTA